MRTILSIFFLLLPVLYAQGVPYNKGKLVVYWGQASAGTQERLAYYCKSPFVDKVVLSFLYEFPDPFKLDFGNSPLDQSYDYQRYPEIEEDIQVCQQLGKTVLLSLGGATGKHTFKNDDEAEEFATTLWDMFGQGWGKVRPFGNAVVDGFDLDFEDGNEVGHTALVLKLRRFFQNANKVFYISASPQCVYPDASLNTVLSQTYVNFVFIQFYNNPCGVEGSFNFDIWEQYAKYNSPFNEVELYLGLPGSPTAANTGYVSDLDKVQEAVHNISRYEHFAGISVWDASQCFGNEVDGIPYCQRLKEILNQNLPLTTYLEGPGPQPTVHAKRDAAPEPSQTIEFKKREAAPAPSQTLVGRNIKRDAAPAPSQTLVGRNIKREAAPEPSQTIEFKKREAAPAPSQTLVGRNIKRDAAPAPSQTLVGRNIKREAAPEPSQTIEFKKREAAPAPSQTLVGRNIKREAAPEPSIFITL